MATMAMPPQKPKAFEAEETKLHRIRITLTSRNVRNLEKGLSVPLFGTY